MGTDAASPSVRIEKMALRDIPFLDVIERMSSPSPWKPEQFQEELNKEHSDFWVLCQNGEPRAFSGYWLIQGEAQLTNIAVHPDYRQRGWGRRLLRWCMERALSAGARVMTLEAREGNAAARRLYESEGFVETSRRPGFYEGRETAVLMERKLK
jgi:ribosomal-protein-alanine N-acetyltransferase